jgi:hypothetical protein
LAEEVSRTMTIDAAVWRADWLWGTPLIVVNVVIHVFGLRIIDDKVTRVLDGRMEHRLYTPMFTLVMALTVVLITLLLAIEASVWAAAYRLLGALPDTGSAMLYSLGAITTYGGSNLGLEKHWQLLGALEALNGVLLFGLTTAFLFDMIQKTQRGNSRRGRR